jgi:alpha-aminoadipic semialdehyde synthase
MENKEKNILILGSGMMVEPLIDYLLKREENKITIASDIYEIAKSISDKKSRCFPEKIDVVKDELKLRDLVKSHDLVISFIPAFLHMYVAIKCLEHNKNMVTASYISDEMKALNDKVKEKKLIFMNEIGLDPGIDHVVAHKVIDDCKEDNSKIISYESWCGALPSPDAIDNPLLYKFSWSPRGALNALKNSVVFLQDGEEKEIQEENVLLSTVEKNFHNCFQFEGYYNRNSVKYREIYELKDVKTLIRGTIRFKGFCFIIQCFKIFGLFNSTDIVKEDIPWRSYFEELFPNNSERIGQTFKTWGANFQIRIYGLNEEDQEFYRKIVFYAISYINEDYLQKHDVNLLCSKFVDMIHFLNFNERSNIVSKYLC